MPVLIETDRLTKTYRLGEVTVDALQVVTLTIDRGSFVAIMGASGSGKSTLMNLLGCLDRPTSGRYLLDGVAVEGLDRDQLAEIRNQKIGFVFQNFNLLPRMSAMENVQLPLMYTSNVVEDADEKAKHVLALVGLAGKEHSLPTQLSGGAAATDCHRTCPRQQPGNSPRRRTHGPARFTYQRRDHENLSRAEPDSWHHDHRGHTFR